MTKSLMRNRAGNFSVGRLKSKTGESSDANERKIFDAYRRILCACNMVDYDDQIILACRLLREHDDIRQDWQVKAAQLLVDEYQDINRPQLELIKLLAGPKATGLFVVGDDDQSIYGFRGAEPDYIRNFEKQFEGGRIKAISDCFRCQPHVINAAHGLIKAFNPHRIEKPTPKCARPEGALVLTHCVPSDAREAEIISAMVSDATREGDVLVLVPKNDYAEQLKSKLRARRIAFDAPTPRPNASNRVFVALRAWLADVRDDVALRELLQAICDGGIYGTPGPRARKSSKIAVRENALAKVSQLWQAVFGGLSLREALAAAKSDEFCGKLDTTVTQLADATAGTPTEFGQRTFEALRPWPNSARMLDQLAVPHGDSRGSLEGDANLVRIMTMRNSKGLEAETVFVIGLEEGAFPSSAQNSPEFEEEARLLYVSMTRAKKQLHLFHARKRSGGRTFKPDSFDLKPSPFIAGLPPQNCRAQYHRSAAQRGSAN